MNKKSPIKHTLLCPALALCILIALMAPLSAQNKKENNDTKKQSNTDSKVVEKKSSPQVAILLEYFKLDHRKANKLISQYSPKAADAGELRDTLGEMIKKGQAELIETGWLRGLSGQRVKTESVREDIYPTEYTPPEIIGGNAPIEPQDEALQSSQTGTKQQTAKASQNTDIKERTSSQIHITSATPTAFETRHVGLTLEVDPVISSDSNMIDISLAPEIVTRLEDRHFTRPGFEHTAHGIDNISMASFYINKTTLQITTIPGNYNLLGFHTPYKEPGKRIIVLLKTDLFLAK